MYNILSFIFSSKFRYKIMEYLAESGEGACRSDLRENISASKQTIYRNLNLLVDKGYVKREGSRFTPTYKGEGVVDILSSIRPQLEKLYKIGIYNDMVPDSRKYNGGLKDIKIICAETHGTYAPERKLLNVIEAGKLEYVVCRDLGTEVGDRVEDSVDLYTPQSPDGIQINPDIYKTSKNYLFSALTGNKKVGVVLIIPESSDSAVKYAQKLSKEYDNKAIYSD